jgi:membrane protein YdbS with pleckstrin-like domain
MATRTIDFKDFKTDTTVTREALFTVRPDMGLIKMSFLVPVLVLFVGVVFYLLPLPIDRVLNDYLVLPFVAMVAVGTAVYPIGMYEALSKAVFTVTDQYVEEEVGTIWKRSRRIPLRYVRDVKCDQNVIQAIFGVADITISTTNGNKIVLNNIRCVEGYREALWKLVLSKTTSGH